MTALLLVFIGMGLAAAYVVASVLLSIGALLVSLAITRSLG